MKKIIFIFFLLLIVGIASIAGWFAYSFNGENYKKQFIEELEGLTGRTVKIDGPVTFSWTPFPTVVISDLSISNQKESSNPEMFSVKQIYVEIGWKSLLKNPLIIKKVVLKNPHLLLERIRSYQTNFDFPSLFKGEQNTGERKFFGKRSFSLTVNEMKVEDGEFTYINTVGKENLTLKGVEGVGKIASLNGPFSFSGSFLLNENREGLDINIGKIEPFQAVEVTINFTDKESRTYIDGIGSVFYDSEKPDEWFKIEGVITSRDLSVFCKKIGLQNWPKESVVGSFTFKTTPFGSILDSLTIRQGKGENETTFFMGMQTPNKNTEKIPTLVVKNFDVEKWFPLIDEIIASKTFNQVKMPYYIQLEETKFHSEVLGQILFEGVLENGILNFSNLTASFPHSTSFTGKGFIDPQKKLIDTDVQLSSEEFRPFVEWFFQKQMPDFSPDLLKTVQWTGHMKLQSNNFDFKAETASLDNIQFSGNLGLNNSVLNTSMEIENLILDDYLEPAKRLFETVASSEITGNFDIKAQNLKVKKYLFNQMNTKGNLAQNTLNIEEISGSGSDGSVLNAKFSLTNLKGDGQKIGNLNTNFSIPNFVQVLGMFDIEDSSVFALNQIKKLTGDFNYAGSQKEGNFKLDVTFDKGTLKGEGKVENFPNVRFSDTKLSTTFAEARNFLSFFKGGENILPNLTGPFELSLTGSGNKENLIIKEFSSKTNKQILNGNFDLNIKDQNLRADITSPDLDLNLFLPSIQKISFLNENTFAINVKPKWQAELTLKADAASYEGEKYTQMNGKLSLKDMVLNIPSFEAVAENKEKASVQGKIVFGTPTIVEGKVVIPQIPVNKDTLLLNSLSFGEGKVSVNGDFKASGNSWNAFARSIRAQGQFSWQNGLEKGINIKELSSLVKRTLKQKGLEEEINAQIDHALANGKSNFSIKPTKFKVEQATLSFEELKGETPDANFSADKGTYSLLTKKLNTTLSIIFNNYQTFPSFDLLIKNNSLAPQIDAFKSALKQEIRIEIDQQKQKERKQEEEEAKRKQDDILEEAQMILIQTEGKVENLKDRFALKSSEELQKLLEDAEGVSSEIRQLAIRSDLNGEQLNFLREKVKLLNIYLSKLDAFEERDNTLRQRESVKKLPPLVKTRIEEIVQIYKENPQSALLAGLVQKSKDEEKKMNQMIQSFSTITDLDETRRIIEDIKASFTKIQKALDYARQFDSETGMISSISGSIEEI